MDPKGIPGWFQKTLEKMAQGIAPEARAAVKEVDFEPGVLEKTFMGASSKPTSVSRANPAPKNEALSYYTTKGKQYHANSLDKFMYDLGIVGSAAPEAISGALDYYANNPKIQRLNPVAQIGAVTQMDIPQAKAFRQEVDDLVAPFRPQLPEIPPAYRQMPLPGNGIPVGLAADMAQGMIDTPAKGVAGAAKLPAATSFGEVGSDVLDVASLVALLLGAKDLLGSAAAPSVKPEVTRVVGKPFVNTVDPSEFAEQQAGWPKGLKSEFDAAMLTKDTKRMLELLPQVPKGYQQRFGSEIARALAQAAAPPPVSEGGITVRSPISSFPSIPSDVQMTANGVVKFANQVRNALGETGISGVPF